MGSDHFNAARPIGYSLNLLWAWSNTSIKESFVVHLSLPQIIAMCLQNVMLFAWMFLVNNSVPCLLMWQNLSRWSKILLPPSFPPLPPTTFHFLQQHLLPMKNCEGLFVVTRVCLSLSEMCVKCWSFNGEGNMGLYGIYESDFLISLIIVCLCCYCIPTNNKNFAD